VTVTEVVTGVIVYECYCLRSRLVIQINLFPPVSVFFSEPTMVHYLITITHPISPPPQLHAGPTGPGRSTLSSRESHRRQNHTRVAGAVAAPRPFPSQRRLCCATTNPTKPASAMPLEVVEVGGT
jgi:hypothetical protein